MVSGNVKFVSRQLCFVLSLILRLNVSLPRGRLNLDRVMNPHLYDDPATGSQAGWLVDFTAENAEIAERWRDVC